MENRSHEFSFIPADPFSFWSYLHPNPRNGFFLGSGHNSDIDHVVYMSVGEPTSVHSTTLIDFQKKIDKKKYTSDLPRYVGHINYESSSWFDSGIERIQFKKDHLNTSPISFGDYPDIIKIDYKKKITTLFSNQNKSKVLFKRSIQKVQSAYEKQNFFSTNPEGKKYQNGFKHINFQEFSNKVLRAKQAIAKGDIYQANLSFRFSGQFKGSVLGLYRRLCQKNPSPYACLLKQGDHWLVSCSPELLIQVSGSKIITRPIAGTRPRGENAKSDRVKKGQLLVSPKEKAEHIMLVDLERNDLGKVSVPGSVQVTERFAIEKYSHVMHIVSEVQGKLLPHKNSLDALSAVFPGGTISGCPKIRSIEIISELEDTARGPFYGSAGYISWNGDCKFNILIRTAHIKNKKVTVQAGAGIVADSHPRREYNEVLAKAKVLLETIGTTTS